MRKILVLRGGALGDFIVTLPALALLRERWPHAHIELVGNAVAARLGCARGLLNEVHSQHEARWAGLFGSAPLKPDFAGWLADFDLVLSYWPDPDHELEPRFPRRADQTFLSAPALPTCGPAAAHYCAPLRRVGIEPHGYFFRLAPLHDTTAAAAAPPTSFSRNRSGTLVHPGSGSPRKNWPKENWTRLLAELPEPVSIILGEAEMRNWVVAQGSLQSSPAPTENHAPKPTHPGFLIQPTLETLVGHLARCRLFLGHDSGISHLAAACGAPCVLLFGPTDPAIWAPPAPQVRVLRRGAELATISVEEASAAAALALAETR